MPSLNLALAMASILIASASFQALPTLPVQEESIKVGPSTRTAMTAYELLEENGFPVGLLPNNVQSYTLDSNSGKFELHLSSQCDVTIPGEYPVRYEKKITGNLSSGSISNLSGVYVKVLLLWWELTRIYMDGDKVVFEVGLLSASYPASNFDESPDCGSNSALF